MDAHGDDRAAKDDAFAIAHTMKWVEAVVIGLSLCPFAKRELDAGSIHCEVVDDATVAASLNALLMACQRLDRDPEIETSLLVLCGSFADFDDYLDVVALAEQLMVSQGYEGVYQLASFHPRYRFEGSDVDDPANYTNRSPYPMLHLLREQRVAIAVEKHVDAERIPERNVERMRGLGLAAVESLQRDCLPGFAERAQLDGK